MKVLHVFTLSTTAESFFDGQFKMLSETGHEIFMAASTVPSNDFCERNAITFHRIDIARRIDITSDFKAIGQLLYLIKKEKFDIVVGHTPKGAMIAMIAASLNGVTHRIYYRHGLIYTTAHGIKRFIFKTVERLTSLLATQIINVSQSLCTLAIKDHLNSNRKQLVLGQGTCGGIDAINVYNPGLIDQKYISILRHNLLGNPDFVIGFCGRICNDKGIRELIDGFKLFRHQHPDLNAKLLLVGPSDQRDSIPEHIKFEIESNTDIIAVGRQSKSKLPEFYSLMDVFVFPSYREGFGMSVIEASAMEIPILVSRSHGCVDSIRENITGQYIDISAKGIADGLEKMLDADNRHKLGKSGREFVLCHFDYSVMWPQIKSFYNETIFNTKQTQSQNYEIVQ